ncbi:hypothetical protein LH51_00775 [Nitrincola sp. A-D6]|nr:hypothetical protein LH51_00775 [Nitrincola sp. A-D6]
MHHAVHQPLRIHLGLAPQRKTIQAFVTFQVAEHWFYRTQALTVDMAAHWAVDLLLHVLDKAGQGFALTQCKAHLPSILLIGSA